MSIVYSPTTELEAVNVMLSVIGEAPVNSLEVSGMIDVSTAKQILHETSRRIQSQGWYCNTEKEYTLNKDTEGFLNLPLNTLKIDLSSSNDYNQIEPVVRGTKLYDKKNHTFVFTNDYKFDIIWFLPFTDLTEALRRYITISAARAFQKRFYSSDQLDAFTREDELYAKVEAEHADGEVADYNMVNNPSVYNIIMR